VVVTNTSHNPARDRAVRVFHIATASDVEALLATGEYTPASFDAEGFIHCSYARQVCAVADRLFRGRRDLILLEIDPAKLDCKIVDENLEGGAERYPHVYGRVPLSAVASMHPFPCGDDGRFEMPLRDTPTPSQS
jgi:uncharacterized protein (DUF952 family)